MTQEPTSTNVLSTGPDHYCGKVHSILSERNALSVRAESWGAAGTTAKRRLSPVSVIGKRQRVEAGGRGEGRLALRNDSNPASPHRAVSTIGDELM